MKICLSLFAVFSLNTFAAPKSNFPSSDLATYQAFACFEKDTLKSAKYERLSKKTPTADQLKAAEAKMELADKSARATDEPKPDCRCESIAFTVMSGKHLVESKMFAALSKEDQEALKNDLALHNGDLGPSSGDVKRQCRTYKK
jgi:hypothetical protein